MITFRDYIYMCICSVGENKMYSKVSCILYLSPSLFLSSCYFLLTFPDFSTRRGRGRGMESLYWHPPFMSLAFGCAGTGTGTRT